VRAFCLRGIALCTCAVCVSGRLRFAEGRERSGVEKFIARQPVFDPNRVIYGYELLFRSGAGNFFPGIPVDVACASTTDNLFLFGIERLTQGHRAFINCSRDFLVRDYAALLPKDRVVIEILENTEPDAEVVAACRRLKQLGFIIALDDFVDAAAWGPLVDVADCIKVDFLAAKPDAQLAFCREYSRRNIRMLAEKVETYADFDRARQYGYSLFQGYFFSRPEILTRHDVPAYKLNYLRVLQAANRHELDQDEIAHYIKAEASLSYRLLRYLNSPAFFLTSEVRSIPHALMMLGERGIRRWVSLVAIACMGEDKPQELLLLPLIRARFCELLAPLASHESAASDLFLMGLLSAIDAILDMKMEEVLAEIAIGSEIRDALLGNENSLRRIFDVALLYERGAWPEFDRAAARTTIAPDAVSDIYVRSMEWASAVLAGEEVPDGAPA
jgi:c-di-GMP-related signal transduction protein